MTLRAALEEIRDSQGQVCDQFEVCSHPSCASSYSSWAIAHQALCWKPDGGVRVDPIQEVQKALADPAKRQGVDRRGVWVATAAGPPIYAREVLVVLSIAYDALRASYDALQDDYNSLQDDHDKLLDQEARLDVERLAQSLPNVMTQESADYIYGEGYHPLDVPDEWFATPREMAEQIAVGYERLTRAAKSKESA